MKCFYHQQTEALGLCKNCMRGICAECLVDVGNGLACRGGCEEEVRIYNDLLQRSRRAYPRLASLCTGIGVVSGVFGLISVAVSFAARTGQVSMLTAGVLSIGGGVLLYGLGRSVAKK